MKHTAIKLTRALCSVVMVLVLAASIIAVPASAASNGIYIATATPHYRHPTTGVIEDSGGESSEVLGQSMTESATYGKALVEVDENGNTYVTVRLQLMDNIQNPVFQVDGSSVSASLMQEDYNNNTADYRMKVNSENSVIRCSMYVVPMGRQVIFYITVSNLQSGSGDFITSITVNPNSQTTTPTASPKTTSTPEASTSPTASASPSASAEPSESAAVESDEPEETDDANVGLEEFDAEGNEVETEDTEESEGSGSSAAVWIIAAVVVVLAAVAAWYFGSYKKKH